MIERTPSAGGFEDVAGYCRAVRAGTSIKVSGTVAVPPEGSTLADMDTYAQTRSALAKATEAVTSLGGDVSTVTFSRIYLSPVGDWRQAAQAHHEAFAATRPANTTVYVSALIPAGGLVEVELEAQTKEESA